MNIEQELNNIKNSFNAILNYITPKYQSFTQSSVLKAVCEHFELTEEQLMGSTKKGIIGEARLVYAYILYYHVSRNKSQISRWMGRKDSHSAIDAISRAEDLMTDKLFNGNVQAVILILSNKSL